MEQLGKVTLFLQVVILTIQVLVLVVQAWILKRQNNIIRSGTDSQLLLEVYRSFFENPLYSAITKAIDKNKLGNTDPSKIGIYLNNESRTYSIGEYKTGARGINLPIGTFEDYLDDYLGWFDVLGILIKSGQLTNKKAEALFRYYLEMALKTEAVRNYLIKSCGNLETFKNYWEGLDYLIKKWNLRNLLPEDFR